MTTQRFTQCPSPSCRCHDCIVEYAKDWEDDYSIEYPEPAIDYYSDEYNGAFGAYSSDFLV